jgi:hypothetical protein
MRLELKVAGDPFNAATERQLLAIAVIAGLWSGEVRRKGQVNPKSQAPNPKSQS